MGQEERICCIISICILVFVMSSVSLLYLTVLIYLPAHRELSAGITQEPVTCQTVEANDTSEDCENWKTCFEWCLSKGGKTCMKVYVSVRQNGKNASFFGCDETMFKRCSKYEPYQAMDRNCTEHPVCKTLQGFHNCTKGVCKNITNFYTCDARDFTKTRNCTIRDKCNNLNGVYYCNRGVCKAVGKNYNCDRNCELVQLRNQNVVLFTTEGYFSARCAFADNKTSLNWTSKDTLLASCASFVKKDTQVQAINCIDGISLNATTVQENKMNFTEFVAFHKNQTYSNNFNLVMPLEENVILTNRTPLRVNLEQCVNSLQDECNTIYDKFGIDGSETRNFSPAAVFPCYYDEDNLHNYVLLKYSREATLLQAIVSAAVPSGLLCLTCLGLILCSKIVQVDGSRMFIQCCPDDVDTGDEQFDEL